MPARKPSAKKNPPARSGRPSSPHTAPASSGSRGHGPQEDELTKNKILILSDGRAGHQNQSLGVAAALGFADPEIVTLNPRFSNSLLKSLPLPFVFGRRQLHELPAATLVISTGWQMGRVARWLKDRARHAHRTTPFLIQMMKPSGRAEAYDVVAIPEHDVRADEALPRNAVVTTGAPNRVSKALLAQETGRWASRLQHCPTPRLAVLIGGASKHGPFGLPEAETLIKDILAWGRRSNGSLLITTSRRTAPPVRAAIEHMLATQTDVAYHLWQPDDPTKRDNPFLAFLGSCTAALVTVESVSMVSEAASAAKPVYLYGDTTRMPKKLQRFYAALKKQGRLTDWHGKLTLRIPREGLNDAALVAGFVRAIWAKSV